MVEASVDLDSWVHLAPTDALMESRREEFDGTLPLEKDRNEEWITVRAQDQAGNRGDYRVRLGP